MSVHYFFLPNFKLLCKWLSYTFLKKEKGHWVTTWCSLYTEAEKWNLRAVRHFLFYILPQGNLNAISCNKHFFFNGVECKPMRRCFLNSHCMTNFNCKSRLHFLMLLRKVQLDFWGFKSLANDLTQYSEYWLYVRQGSRCLRNISEQSRDTNSWRDHISLSFE